MFIVGNSDRLKYANSWFCYGKRYQQCTVFFCNAIKQVRMMLHWTLRQLSSKWNMKCRRTFAGNRFVYQKERRKVLHYKYSPFLLVKLKAQFKVVSAFSLFVSMRKFNEMMKFASLRHKFSNLEQNPYFNESNIFQRSQKIFQQ